LSEGTIQDLKISQEGFFGLSVSIIRVKTGEPKSACMALRSGPPLAG
jgi:hypothetical protein